MFRGFETMLEGRAPLDALVIAPRVCGICSVAQSLAARSALAGLTDLRLPRNAERVFNLMQAIENTSDLLSHFYLYLAPELQRQGYKDRKWFAQAKRFALGTEPYKKAVAARNGLLGMLAPLAGKWPHSLSMLPGGLTKTIGASERAGLLDHLGEFEAFVSAQVFGGGLQAFINLKNTAQLADWALEYQHTDLGLFIQIGLEEGWERLGLIKTPLLSYGAYFEAGFPLFAGGVWKNQVEAFDWNQITEDLGSSWLDGPFEPLSPAQGVTRLDAEREGAYSYAKAPRYQGQVVSVGPWARQVIDGQPLARALNQTWGSGVLSRVLARWIELGRLLPQMRQWLEQIEPDQPFYHSGNLMIKDGQSFGLIEAARGSLGHFLEIEGGRITRYQILAPTSWNFSPRDQTGQPGPAEQALVGLPLFKGKPGPELGLVIRSFDPCMQCQVH